MFLSADLAGSTAYKISHAEDPTQWAETFRSFFGDFPRFLHGEYGKLADFEDSKLPDCSEEVKPWKFSGDEILFTAKLSDHRHVATHIAAFKNAVTKYPKEWQKKEVPLRLKASGWLAGFPVTNTELALSTADNESLRDFVGPSIDLGFRVASQATPRKFMLTADLALMLLDAIEKLELEKDFCEFRCDGRKELKGVLNGNPYPLVWIDAAEDNCLDKLEDTVATLHRDRAGSQDDFRKFLRRFIDEHTPPLFRPFIGGDTDDKYGKINETIAKRRDKLMRAETESGYTVMGEDEDQAPEPDQPTAEELEPPKTKPDLPHPDESAD